VTGNDSGAEFFFFSGSGNVSDSFLFFPFFFWFCAPLRVLAPLLGYRWWWCYGLVP
jgi:hypothetical protein